MRIENIPVGFRAKETYKIVNENEFMETFELAGQEKDYPVGYRRAMDFYNPLPL